jgi:signal recognition particle subunit SRP54
MFSNLADKLSEAFKRLRSKGKLTEADVKVGMREIKLALLEADVNFKVVKAFVNKVSERAVGAEVMESLLPGQQIVKIVNEELTALMGGSNSKLNISPKPPTVVLMCGLQGSGKTTHTAKLAKMYKKQGKNPLLVACDIYRPAAIKQLQVVAEQVGVPVFERGTQNPAATAKEAIQHAVKYGHDMVFVDTAGRLQIDEKMMGELLDIKEAVKPDEILLVVDSMTGQVAVDVAKTFNEQLDITGVVMTKLDGDT